MPSLNFTEVHVQNVRDYVVPRNPEEVSLCLALGKTSPSSGTPVDKGMQWESSLPPPADTLLLRQESAQSPWKWGGGVPAANGGWAFTALACLPGIHHVLSYLPYPAVPLSSGPLACLSPPSALTVLGNTWSVLPSSQGLIHSYINYF